MLVWPTLENMTLRITSDQMSKVTGCKLQIFFFFMSTTLDTTQTEGTLNIQK